MEFMTFQILGIIIPTKIFQRVETTNQGLDGVNIHLTDSCCLL